MSNIDLVLAQTQRNITYLYVVMFAAVLAALMFLPKPLDDSTKTLLITLFTVLGTLITQQSNFWFARPRSAGIPDPSLTETKETKTVTTETKTAAAPAVSVTIDPPKDQTP